MAANDALQGALNWLALQQQAMLDGTIKLAEINSGSLHAAGVSAVADAVSAYVRDWLSLDSERIKLADFQRIDSQGHMESYPLGPLLRFGKHPRAPLQILLCAHLDTVFAVDSPFQQTRWLDQERLQGPGVTDLKGGIMVMLKALEALEISPLAGRIGWQVVLNPDEEIGSISSAPILAAAAAQAHLGLVYEPCLPNGHLAGNRKGSGNFTLCVQGRSAHAGREHHLGRNAVRAVSDFICALDDLNGQRPGLTINPAFVQGGGANNVVPDFALCRFNIRLQTSADQNWCQTQLQTLLQDVNARDGLRAELHGQFTRAPKVLSKANLELFQQLRDAGQTLGMDIQWQDTGGCCDGNNLAAAGLANIDTLGVQGGNIHSATEFLWVPSLVQRARLSTTLLLQLADDPQQALKRLGHPTPPQAGGSYD